MPDTNSLYDLAGYDYFLPEHLIAQQPTDERCNSRLLVMDCTTDSLHDRKFSDIMEYFRAGDLLVVNDTRVFPARLLGAKDTGGRVEFFLLHYPKTGQDTGTARARGLLKCSKKVKPGAHISLGETLTIRVDSYDESGTASLTLLYTGELDAALAQYGRVPLPPYIRRDDAAAQPATDQQRYQTVYARHTGAVAAPTAGFHFSDDLLQALAMMGVRQTAVTLHVGYGTFAPVRSDDIRQHQIHHEHVRLTPATAALVNQTKANGGRIFSVGTTTARTLEFAAAPNGTVHPTEGPCDLYIYPGYRFRVVDNLITNFHLPKSSLLFLVSALAGRQHILTGYNHAVAQGYRFFSYGDAMLILTK